MSPRQQAAMQARVHERARDLAALGLDEPLGASDASWLDAHLSVCDECCAAAAAYADQRAALRSLRSTLIEPPRDLWARTAAAIESESARRPLQPSPALRFRRSFSSRFRPAFLVPLAAVVVVAIAVGAGLLNGTALLPPGTGAMPTPFPLAAADVQVLSRAADGSVQLLSQSVNEVCPVSTADCGISRGFQVTSVSGVGGSASLYAVFSPNHDHLVVVAAGGGRPGVYVLPMAIPPASASPAPTTGGSNTPSSTQPASPVIVPGGTPSDNPQDTSPVISTSPAATPSPSASAGDGSASPTAPTPSPSIAISPQPGGAIEIASNVVVVGSAAYSPDGTHVAFSARPADGSTGPDVYLWTAGEPTAHALTKDHDARFASWTTAGILVSRVVNAVPRTTLLDPATGAETPVAIGEAWLPVVDPTGMVGAWWAGTVRRNDAGDWVPDHGSLVIGQWPASAGAGALRPAPSPDPSSPAATATAAPSAHLQSGTPTASPNTSVMPATHGDDQTAAPLKAPRVAKTPPPSVGASPGGSADPGAGASAAPSTPPNGLQVLATGALAAWSVRWDETGSVVAVWTLGADTLVTAPGASVTPSTPAGTTGPTVGASTEATASGGPDTAASPASSADPSPLALPSDSPGPTVPTTSESAGTQVAPSPAASPAAATPAPSATGLLSLYRVDLVTGLVDAQQPMLDAAPADGGFSLRSGRLAWMSRTDAGGEMLSVLAWYGDTIGRLQFPAEHGATVVP